MNAGCGGHTKTCSEEGCAVAQCSACEGELLKQCTECDYFGCDIHINICVSCGDHICANDAQLCDDCTEPLHFACAVSDLCDECYDHKSDYSEAEEASAPDEADAEDGASPSDADSGSDSDETTIPMCIDDEQEQ